MAGLGQVFNANEVPDAEGGNFEPMPAGEYVLQVTESSVKTNSKNTGMVAAFVMEVVEPVEFQGRKVWEYISFVHENAQTQSIGQAALRDLTFACGKDNIEDTEELHYEHFRATLKIEKGKDQHGNERHSNRVKKFLSPEGDQSPPESKAAPAPRTPPAPSSAGAAAGGAAKTPWKRKAA